MRGYLTAFCISIALATALTACGGPSDSPPGPLGHHYDDMYIAAVPIEQKQGVVQTQQDWSVAKMENAKAEADFNETTTQLQVARNDQKASKLQVDSAVSQKKSAEASNDTNRINSAQRDLHAAEQLAKASEARVHYLEAYREYMRRYSRYTAENMYWREAQFEQAKAQIGKQNNIAPKGVTYDWYPKQIDERGKRAQHAKENADGGKQKAAVSRESWIQVQSSADKEAGKPSPPGWDPLAPKAAPTAGNSSSSTQPTNPPNGNAGNGSAEGEAPQ